MSNIVKPSPYSSKAWEDEADCPYCKCTFSFGEGDLMLLPKFVTEECHKIKGEYLCVKCPSTVCSPETRVAIIDKPFLVDLMKNKHRGTIVGRYRDKDDTWINNYIKDGKLVTYSIIDVRKNMGLYLHNHASIKKYLTQQDKETVDQRETCSIL